MIEVLHIADCPNWERTKELLDRVTAGPVATRLIASAEEAEAIGFCGSPTVRVDGIDPWADQNSRVGLACRIYRLPNGRVGGGPNEEMVRAALR